MLSQFAVAPCTRKGGMFVSNLERLDPFVTLKTGGVSLWNGFLHGTSKGEIEDKEEKRKERYKKSRLFKHKVPPSISIRSD
jgi:hypothetical protein